jgi:hypothetical protein
MPFQRKYFASVPPLVIIGTTRLPGTRAVATRRSVSPSGVSSELVDHAVHQLGPERVTRPAGRS